MDLTNDDLTIRLTGSHVVFSTDDGRSFACGDGLSSTIRSLLDACTIKTPAPRSAATLAAFAEARNCRPIDAPAGDLVAARPEVGASIVIGPAARADEGIGPLLRQRRSTRKLRPCSLADLSTLLFSGARIIEEWPDRQGVNVSHRPHPSAGGRHPLSILVLVSAVEGLSPGAWEFEPSRCALTDVGWGPDRLDVVLAAASDALTGYWPPVLLMAVAEPERTLSRYPAGTAHLWRDTGALLATLHLLAASLGLASCIVGTSGLLGNEDAARIDLGALAFGF